MIEKSDAIKLVSKKLEYFNSSDDLDTQYVIDDKETIEKPFGWIFFYNSKRFLETGDNMFRLAGNGPVFVHKDTGSVDFFGSKQPLEIVIKYYEDKLKQK